VNNVNAAKEVPASFGERIYRPNTVEVDLDAIKNNTRIVKDIVGPRTTLFAAVKSNGYGLGLPAVAEAMLAGGADGFTLSDPADAISIRNAGIKIPILLYGGILPSPLVAAELHRLDLMCTVTDVDAARAYSVASTAVASTAVASTAPAPLGVFAKIDVGLERLGTYPEHGVQLVRTIMELPGIRLAGIYSHIHGTEVTAYRDWQLGRFDRLLRELAAAGIRVPLRMSESSASLGLRTGSMTNAADPGHLLYGIAPGGRRELPDGIRPALHALKSRLIQVKDFQRNEFQEESPVQVGQVRRIGVLPIGRADGLQYLTTGRVRVRGQLVPIIGRLSLEHTRIDLTAIPDSQAGDEVEIIHGRPGSEISAADVAAASQLDQVGLLVALGSSIRRAYLPSQPPGS
jgi:alanine racemase